MIDRFAQGTFKLTKSVSKYDKQISNSKLMPYKKDTFENEEILEILLWTLETASEIGFA